ncbi:MAG: hypothetical protein UT63_C0071G0005 [Candidatus Gottesmanbacteria bacterium GW2011_GWC2_39_8]|uniref:Uncharacterized protein n=1 Tax=Candidatus Gottesmanbacteria bacterium GW2011_GWC2_39_8 TaxID=1618450 RepID=A0A0G0S9G8_9BACT|nr:MAG: hypothetical protein UT63_C0071G0005 [Candidatus Gottesmanbacteria bacterium GW2011_GWC2_39_8]
MPTHLNSDQLKALSDFFFDISKALVIGTFGFSAVNVNIPVSFRIINIVGGVILTYFCIKIGLSLLEES